MNKERDIKKYYFDNKIDFIKYLHLLIEYTLKQKGLFENTFDELENMVVKRLSLIFDTDIKNIKKEHIEILIKEKMLIRDDEGNIRAPKNYKIYNKIDYLEYKNIEAKINYYKDILFNAIGDRTKTGVSYWKYRDEVEKKGKSLEIICVEHNQEIKTIMNELASCRNYAHHLCDAKFIEWREYRDRQFSEMKKVDKSLRQEGIFQEFVITKYKHMDVLWLWQLYFSSKNTLTLFDKIFNMMMGDYIKLVGGQVDVTYIEGEDEVMEIDHMNISRKGIQLHKGKTSS